MDVQTLARRILRLIRESSLPPGFEGFGDDEMTTHTPAPSARAAMEKTYHIIQQLKVGNVIKVGTTSFEVSQFFSVPAFKKVGTAGNKWYHVNYYEDGTVGMYQVGGSGQRLGPDVVRGRLVKL